MHVHPDIWNFSTRHQISFPFRSGPISYHVNANPELCIAVRSFPHGLPMLIFPARGGNSRVECGKLMMMPPPSTLLTSQLQPHSLTYLPFFLDPEHMQPHKLDAQVVPDFCP